MGNCRFSFSLKGFLSIVLVMVPNIIWTIVPPANNMLAENIGPYPIFDMIEQISRVIMIAFLIALVRNGNKIEKRTRVYIGLGAVFLAGYYVLWVCYYAGIISPWLLVGMAVLPALYFIVVGMWLKNYVAIIPSVIFGTVHIAITCSNYL